MRTCSSGRRSAASRSSGGSQSAEIDRAVLLAPKEHRFRPPGRVPDRPSRVRRPDREASSLATAPRSTTRMTSATRSAPSSATATRSLRRSRNSQIGRVCWTFGQRRGGDCGEARGLRRGGHRCSPHAETREEHHQGVSLVLPPVGAPPRGASASATRSTSPARFTSGTPALSRRASSTDSSTATASRPLTEDPPCFKNTSQTARRAVRRPVLPAPRQLPERPSGGSASAGGLEGNHRRALP